MPAEKITPEDIDEYIVGFPENVQETLQKVRATIRQAAPDAQETINYAIPTFTLEGNLVHFAAYKKHIAFYPTSSGIEHFKQDLSPYKTSKGTVQFPLGQPIPYDLITRITAFRVQENLEKAAAKRNKKSYERSAAASQKGRSNHD